MVGTYCIGMYSFKGNVPIVGLYYVKWMLFGYKTADKLIFGVIFIKHIEKFSTILIISGFLRCPDFKKKKDYVDVFIFFSQPAEYFKVNLKYYFLVLPKNSP